MGPKAKRKEPMERRRSSPKEGREKKVPLASEEKIHSWLRSSRIPSEIRGKISKFAASALPVFVHGEEGTGRTEVAKAVYLLGPLKTNPFLHLPCRQLTVEKFTERLSFWLKDRTHEKRIYLTLYLEELESLDWDTQAILYGLLKDQSLPWPGLEGVSLVAQVISSSSSSLAEAVTAKRFREDLFHTLEMLTIALKPLRERKEEIPQLVSEILQERRPERMFQKKFSPEAFQALKEYDWPGNLQELESVVLRSVSMKEGDLLQPEDIIFRFADTRPELPLTHKEERGSWFEATLPTLAHEIKNPLVAISTFAHLLPEKYDDPEFRQEFSRLVNQDVRRINELLENLLEFTQFTTPRSTPNDLNFILVEVLKQQEKVLHQRGGKITTELGEELPLVLFDEGQLNFVLRNLLENAISKMSQDTPLYLSTRLSPEAGIGGKGEFVDLKMGYNGQGGMLGPVQRAPGSERARDFQNVSLALLLIRRVMVQNRGKMQVGQDEEAGRTIQLRFPVAR